MPHPKALLVKQPLKFHHIDATNSWPWWYRGLRIGTGSKSWLHDAYVSNALLHVPPHNQTPAKTQIPRTGATAPTGTGIPKT
jgi:hypothetical protein